MGHMLKVSLCITVTMKSFFFFFFFQIMCHCSKIFISFLERTRLSTVTLKVAGGSVSSRYEMLHTSGDNRCNCCGDKGSRHAEF